MYTRTAVVWPAGLDRSILRSLPLSVRTYNCLVGARLMEGDSLLKAEDLLHLPNFGVHSLKDLLVNVAKFLLKCARETSINSIDAPTQTGSTPWGHAGESLLPLLATSAELLGTQTLAESLHPDLLRLASRMGLTPALHAIKVHEVTEQTQGVPMLIAARLEQVLEATQERHHTIIQLRLFQTPPATLNDVGCQLGITRERVRQISGQVRAQDQGSAGQGTSDRCGDAQGPSQSDCPGVGLGGQHR